MVHSRGRNYTHVAREARLAWDTHVAHTRGGSLHCRTTGPGHPALSNTPRPSAVVCRVSPRAPGTQRTLQVSSRWWCTSPPRGSAKPARHRGTPATCLPRTRAPRSQGTSLPRYPVSCHVARGSLLGSSRHNTDVPRGRTGARGEAATCVCHLHCYWRALRACRLKKSLAAWRLPQLGAGSRVAGS